MVAQRIEQRGAGIERQIARLSVDGEADVGLRRRRCFDLAEGEGMVCACSSRPNTAVTMEAMPSTRRVME